MFPRSILRTGLALFPLLAAAQTTVPAEDRAGMPLDWSHLHVIFSQPATEDQFRQLDADPRYSLQTLRRTHPQFAEAAAGFPAATAATAAADPGRDWSEAIGTSPYTLSSPTYPAKYSFNVNNPTPSCTSDYVVYTLPVSTGPAAFNVIAFNNLYVNAAGNGLCPGSTPNVLFAYNATQAIGTPSTGPVISLDGTLIAFVEKSTAAQFHVLKWHGGDKPTTFPKPFNGTGPLASCVTTNGAAPCEYSVAFSTTTSTLGSPYVDYASDTAYLTDDKGSIYAVSPVFKATPAKPPALVAGYPVSVSTSRLTAPVYDTVSGNVFVADTSKLLYLRTKATSAGACLTGVPPCAGKLNVVMSTGSGIATTLEAPLVDSTNGTVFAFAYSGPPYNGDIVVQSNTTLSLRNVANISGTIGASTASTIYAGTFNNAYYNNPTSGLLYACGQDNFGHFGALWAVGFSSATTMKTTAPTGPLTLTTASLSGASAPCSSLTEVFNQTAGKDFLYTGVTSKCAFGASATGCLLAFDITSGFPTTAAANFPSNSGTGGIVIDNVVGSLASATNLYFLTAQPQGGGAPCTVFTGGTNTTGNCAVMLTQSGLH